MMQVSRRRSRMVKGRWSVGLLVVAIAAAPGGLAIAQIGSDDSQPSPKSKERGVGVPEGPFVDFCPTPEQVESHLQIYGFDYKPTVACSSEGQIVQPDGAANPDELDDLPDSVRMERQDALLRSAERLPDLDNNPGTIEVRLPDGTEGQIIIYTDDSERFRNLTPAEFMDLVNPE
jgi:hypothetical protein